MKITDKEINTIRLIMRSPDLGLGWRNVSSACWPLVDGFTKPELIETKKNSDGGGTVRLSERGAVLSDYL